MAQRLWHISDTHLSCSFRGPPIKDMIKFGPAWLEWDKKLADSWDRNVKEDDVVLLGGDILWPSNAFAASWAYLKDRPGKIYFIDGNHDKFIRKATSHRFGVQEFNSYMKEKFGAEYLGATGLIKIGNTGILSQKLCDLPTHTFYAHYDQGRYINELEHLKNLIDKHEKEMKECKNRVFMSHYPPMDNHLNYNSSPWLEEIIRLDPTHCLYGHYHGSEVLNFLPNCDTEWRGIKFMNTSLDLYGFKMRLVLEEL
jgi:predicted phosphohydrolase